MTRAEQETVISWDREEQMVHIWTADPVTQRKMEKLGIEPVKETHAQDNGELTGRFYELPLARFAWGLKRQMSESQRDRLRERGFSPSSRTEERVSRP